MEQRLPFFLQFLLGAFLVLCATSVQAQTGVFDPNDPVVTYNPSAPPAQPPAGQVGKWVRTVKVGWNSTSFKCYIYNGLPFRLKFPKNYDPSKSYPILIFFHGKDEYGKTIYENEMQLSLGGQAHMGAVDNGAFNGFLLYPSNQTQYWYANHFATINDLIEKVMVPQGMVDPFRVYIDGLSAGGQATWRFLFAYPKLVAAATPISAADSSYVNYIEQYKFTPIYHFQGGLDPNPKPELSRYIGSKILAAGGNYKYKEFVDLGHSCWNQSWALPDYFPFYAAAHKANPWPLKGKTDFCTNESINVTIGVTAGFDAYEWRKNGVLISGATSNQITVSDIGTYDCRIKKGTLWSVWSPIPVIIKRKPLTIQPDIQTTGLASRVIPAPDGATAVPLEVPEGYASYNWQMDGNSTTLSSVRYLSASTPGNYKVQVTENGGCPTPSTGVSPSPALSRIQAEGYTAMSGVAVENTTDAGGGQNVTSIDAGDWMDYSVSVSSAGTYTLKLRISTPNNGAQLQIKDGSGMLLSTVSIPNTGNWNTYKDVIATVNLAGGTQTLRIQSTATPQWKFNFFEVYTLNGLSGQFSKIFTVVNANGANKPDPVSNLTAAATSKTAIQLKWSQTAAPAYNETGFEIYQATASGGPFTLVAITGANAITYTFNGLISGVQYFYKVRAVNDYAASAVSAVVSATTIPDTTAPTTPANLRLGAITSNSVELLWDQSKDDVGVFKYDIYVNGTRALTTSGIRYIVYNLLPSTAYTFTVLARDAAKNKSAFSNAVTATTLSGTVKQDPSQTPASPNNYATYLNFNLDNPAAAPWNNTNVAPSTGAIFRNLRNYSNNGSGVDVTIVNNFSGYNGNGMTSGIFPTNVMRGSYYCDKGVSATLRVDGLRLNYKYSFIFFGSRDGGGDRTSVYTIGSQSVSLNASYNTSNTVQIDNVVPDDNGSVTIKISLGQYAQFAYLNCLIIKGYSPEAQSASTARIAASIDNPVIAPVQGTINAYPNPFTNDITLSIPVTQQIPELMVRVADVSGRIISAQQFKEVPQGIWQQRILVNGSSLQPGVYFIHIAGLPGNKEEVIKVMKR